MVRESLSAGQEYSRKGDAQGGESQRRERERDRARERERAARDRESERERERERYTDVRDRQMHRSTDG